MNDQRRHRWNRRLRTGVAIGALATLTLGLNAPSASAAIVEDCTQWGTTQLQNGEYIYQQNEWNSESTQCATIDTETGAWTLTQANFGLPTNGAPATYPSTFKGCHWGACTNPASTEMPIQVSDLGSATSSWSTSLDSGGAYNVAYDLWVNSTPATDGQPDGTEIMIWLYRQGGVQPIGGPVDTVTIDGRTWEIWLGDQTSWNVISFLQQGGNGDTQAPTVPSGVQVTGTTSGSASLSWNASSDNVGVTGYTVYRDGSAVGTTGSTSFTDSGLQPVTSYSYTVAARDAAGNTSAQSAPVTATTGSGNGGGDGCQATYQMQSDWGSGFVADVTVTNTGDAALSGWAVEWSWGGNQQITQYWSADLSQSGQSVSASNLGWNGNLDSGSSANFGFQGTYSGSNGTPTLTCTTG